MVLSKFAWCVAASVLLSHAALATQGASSPNSPQSPGAASQPKPEAWHPNVLFILCDQLNPRMLGHEDNGYGGVSQSLTPNLDSLAAGGVRFSNATTASAVCQASRYSILTGRWAFHHGVRINGIWEPIEETTFPELAQAAGYRTANLGLHHLWWLMQHGPWRDDHGFDENLDLLHYSQYCAANGKPTYNAPNNIWAMPGLPVYGQFEDTGYTHNTNEFHPTGYFADETIRFLRERAGPQGDGKPFVCWYSMISPHTPILPSGAPSSDWAHMYHPFDQLTLPPNFAKVATTQRLAFSQAQFAGLSEDQFREALSYYYALISQLDWNVGRVLDELDQLGIAGDTLVVFTTDHGEMSCEMSSWTKGAGNYDPLTRVPLIMRLPGVLPAGRTIDEPVVNLDIFPTLVEVTGVPIADGVRDAVDGRSLVELMVEPAPPADWPTETFHVLGTSEEYSQHHFMVRTQTAKYTYDELDGAEEFYDLANDPWEIDDRFADQDVGIQAQILSLKLKFQAWWNDAQGHRPHYKPVGDWNAKPSRPFYPEPANHATDVARDVDPRWLPSTAAGTQQVFFGTDASNLPPLVTLSHMEERFNPGTLEPSTTYYWRVDQINGNGTTPGLRWQFTTTAGGAGGPGLAAAPSPAHQVSEVPFGSWLSWTPSPAARTQDVYFGPAGAMQLLATGLLGDVSTWDPGRLKGGVSYEWRVDSLDATGVTEGSVWRFDVSAAGLPARAQPLQPTHLSASWTGADRLTWAPAEGATSHDVYFGTHFPLAFQGNQVASSWDAGPLVPGQTYYWRVDAVNTAGTTTGWTSRFTR